MGLSGGGWIGDEGKGDGGGQMGGCGGVSFDLFGHDLIFIFRAQN